jgi:hypothetical protein
VCSRDDFSLHIIDAQRRKKTEFAAAMQAAPASAVTLFSDCAAGSIGHSQERFPPENFCDDVRSRENFAHESFK